MTENNESRYFNRELSWLEFNQRVLDEARDASNPLLERLKFLAITASNLDEFFMVRVGGLQLLRDSNATAVDPAGMSVLDQLQAIVSRTRTMVRDQYRCLSELETQLGDFGIRRLTRDGLTESQRNSIRQNYEEELVSVLTPMAVDHPDELPHLMGGRIHLCVRLKASSGALAANSAEDEQKPRERFALIAMSESLPRILHLPSEQGLEFLLVDEAVKLICDRFFPEAEIIEQVSFRVTRNADMRVREDSASDLMSGMEEILQERNWSDCVRLELESAASKPMRAFLQHALQAADDDLFLVPGPLDLSAFMSLTSLHGYESLKAESWSPQPSPLIDPSESLFKTISRQSLVLYHPYESFEPVVRLIEEAADDPDVLAIKQTLYRTSKDSPIIKALVRAAENGKNVTVLVELKARFDEQRNIHWARRLENAGAHVIHGVKGLKTHAKTCIIVRREPQGVQRYVHFGTGNYNESTARLYSDVSYLTSDDDLGSDAIAFFNAISGFSQPQKFRKIEAAPLALRDKLLELIEIEIQRKQDGLSASITAKVNSLVDPTIIEALYAASQAGVQIRLSVRGICCLRPGVPGLSENIRVISIIDRFLEHARIILFHHGGDHLAFISSADWMQRNLDKRIELLVPVEEAECKARLMNIMETQFADNVKARELLPDGRYVKAKPAKGKSAVIRSQIEMCTQAVEAYEQHQRQKLTTFELHEASEER